MALHQRRPCLKLDAVRTAKRLQLFLREPRVILDLVDHRFDGGIFQQVFQMVNVKIADADCFDAPLFIKSFKGFPRRFIAPFNRPVDQV